MNNTYANIRNCIAFIILAGAGLPVIASAENFVREDSHEFPADSIDRIAVATGSGDINFEVWDKAAVEVVILQSVKAKNEEKAGKIFAATDVDIEEKDGTLKVEIEHDSGGFWNSILSANPDVNVTVKCPSRMDVKSVTGSGDVRAEGLDGELKFTTGSGDITTKKLKGSFKANTGSGDINLEQVEGEVSANTGSGDIHIDGLTGTFKSGTGSGDIWATGAISHFKAATGSGDVDIRSSVNLVDDTKIATGSGDITIKLPESCPFALDAETNSGSIECAFALANLKSSDETLEGEANGSGPRLVLRAGSGDLSVLQY